MPQAKPFTPGPIRNEIVANGGVARWNVAGYALATVFIKPGNTGAFVGFNGTFEVSIDSTNGVDGQWVAIQANRSNANTIELVTGALSAAPAYAHVLNVAGYNWLRVRATALTSGSVYLTAGLAVDSPSLNTNTPLPTTVTSTPASAPTVIAGQVINTVSSVLANGPTLVITRVAATASTNSTLARTGVARLVGGTLFNTSAATKYFKLYAKATAPTVGTDVPIMTIPIAPSGRVDLAQVIGPSGLNIALGLGFGITGAVADADTTATAANDVIGALIYV